MTKEFGPAWFYGPNGQKGVFDNEADVPKGWVDHPNKVKTEKPAETKAPAAPAPKKAGRPAKKADAKPLDL